MPKTTKPTTATSCCGAGQHPDHSSELARLNRLAGQVEGVKKMIAERRYCPDILAQLRAIRSAAHAIEANLLEAHLDACVHDAFTAGSDAEKQKKMEELKALYRRYNG